MKEWSAKPPLPKMKDLQAILVAAYQDKLIECKGLTILSAFTGILLPQLTSPEEVRQQTRLV